jgi:Flp pilus assembly protein TadG
MPTTVPLAADGGLDKSSFGYSPGGPKTYNMVRAYYQWQIVTDLIRPYISNIRPTSGGSYFLIVETAAFQNEDYP